jgi:Holliday junction resolvase RusA-like endonuclease
MTKAPKAKKVPKPRIKKIDLAREAIKHIAEFSKLSHESATLTPFEHPMGEAYILRVPIFTDHILGSVNNRWRKAKNRSKMFLTAQAQIYSAFIARAIPKDYHGVNWDGPCALIYTSYRDSVFPNCTNPVGDVDSSVKATMDALCVSHTKELESASLILNDKLFVGQLSLKAPSLDSCWIDLAVIIGESKPPVLSAFSTVLAEMTENVISADREYQDALDSGKIKRKPIRAPKTK